MLSVAESNKLGVGTSYGGWHCETFTTRHLYPCRHCFVYFLSFLLHYSYILREQHKISEMSTKIDAARLLTWKAAYARDSGESFTKEAAMAKLFASETATFCSHSVMIKGLNGGCLPIDFAVLSPRGTNIDAFGQYSAVLEVMKGISPLDTADPVESLIHACTVTTHYI